MVNGEPCMLSRARRAVELGRDYHEEGIMKRKGHRTIPDFSKKLPPNPHAPPPKLKVAPPPTPQRTVKPQATSAKSGQRGR
jgi:hypothetical protein